MKYPMPRAWIDYLKMNDERYSEEELAMKYPTPKAWTEYILMVEAQYPKLCYNCEFLDENGVCRVYGQEPPIDFYNTPNACEKWDQQIPF